MPPSREITATFDPFLPDLPDPLDLDGQGSTSAVVPRLDAPPSLGAGIASTKFLLADKLLRMAERAEHHAARGEEDEARRQRAQVVGMLHAYNLVVRVVLDDGEVDPRQKYVYDDAVAQVRADHDAVVEYWYPIDRKELSPIERYHRLTKVQQQVRPGLVWIVRERAEALTDAMAEGDWTVDSLAVEVGMTPERLERFLSTRFPGPQI